MKLNNAIMWVAVSLAVIVGFLTTKDINCLLGLIIPTFITVLEIKDDDNERNNKENNNADKLQ